MGEKSPRNHPRKKVYPRLDCHLLCYSPHVNPALAVTAYAGAARQTCACDALTLHRTVAVLSVHASRGPDICRVLCHRQGLAYLSQCTGEHRSTLAV